MEPDIVLEALAEFEKRPTKEVTPPLEQFLQHIAKTGETMYGLPWSQLKSFFLYTMEKVMDDFSESSPEFRGPPSRNVEYVPYDEMKERLLKIVDGFTSAPFTIQRLCELLTDPKKHYKRTDKFLRGIEKNVLVVSSVYPSSDKFSFSANTLSRVNGILPSASCTAFQDRSNVNGPGTPRPLNRSRSASGALSTNGFEVSGRPADADPSRAQSPPLLAASPTSESGPLKTKLLLCDMQEDEDAPQAKRLRFNEDDEETGSSSSGVEGGKPAESGACSSEALVTPSGEEIGSRSESHRDSSVVVPKSFLQSECSEGREVAQINLEAVSGTQHLEPNSTEGSSDTGRLPETPCKDSPKMDHSGTNMSVAPPGNAPLESSDVISSSGGTADSTVSSSTAVDLVEVSTPLSPVSTSAREPKGRPGDEEEDDEGEQDEEERDEQPMEHD
uniref:serine/threonine-protein phosphatase 4 regulatory subunit 2 isoform X2 n=1 Tax=Myxine glutinosa TaxID=7769 RepID=UPI00358EA551